MTISKAAISKAAYEWGLVVVAAIVAAAAVSAIGIFVGWLSDPAIVTTTVIN